MRQEIKNIFYLKFAILIACSNVFALDQYSTDPDTTSTEISIPEIVCIEESNGSLFNWKEHPEKFIFKVFDRWGNEFATTTEPDFVFGEIWQGETNKPDPVLYVYYIEYYNQKGEGKKYTGTILVYGYCECG